MNALTLGKALGGAADGYMAGVKINEDRAATRLNQLVTEQALAKNELLLKSAREDDMKQNAATEIDAELWKVHATKNLSEFKEYFAKIRSPFTVGNMVNADDTVDIISTVDGSKLNTVSFPEFANSVYRPVAGKDHEIYSGWVAGKAAEAKTQGQKEVITLRGEEARKTKTTAPAVNQQELGIKQQALDVDKKKADAYAKYISGLEKGGGAETPSTKPSAASVFGTKK